MTYYEFIDQTDILLTALTTCALTGQDARFDEINSKIDKHYTDNPEHYQRMIESK